MGKHTKLSAERLDTASQAVAAGPLTGEEMASRLRLAADHIQSLLGACAETMRQGELTPALARESAALARAMAGLSAEQRARERHVKNEVAEMSPTQRDQVIWQYLEALPIERRRDIASRLQRLDVERVLVP